MKDPVAAIGYRFDPMAWAAAFASALLHIGVAAALLAAKWLHATSGNLNAVLMASYYIVFLACVAWAFRRGAARAAPELLGLCAMAGFAIPATSLLARVAPSLGMWAHGSMGVVGVDLTSLVLALLLAWAARLAARRARSGPPDSVWAAPAAAAPEPAFPQERQA